jgi:hypothetical protein
VAIDSLFIDSTEIKNDTQLAFQEHKVQELISKQIDLEYGVSDILTIITLLVALGAMMVALVGNRISSLSNLKTNDVYSIAIAATILAGCLGYGIYAEYKKRTDRVSIQTQITQTIYAIRSYHKGKAGQ